MANVLVSTKDMPYGEWLDWRKKGIGGSDASVICGINRYKSPVELWAEKTGMFPQQEAGEAAYWGTQLESLVRAEFTKRTGIEVTQVNQILQSEQHSFMLANVDGMCCHPEYGSCIFEAKTTSVYNSMDWEDSIPDAYMLQVQHYMAVTGYKGTYIAVLIGGNQFKWKYIERDEELINMLIKLEDDFWNRVQSNTPPPLDDSEASANFLNERFPNSIPKSTIELPEEAVSLIDQYISSCETVKQYEQQKQEAENLLKQMLGENEAGTAGDRTITWKTISQERLDSKTLKIEHPKLYEKYSNKTTYRRFSIK
jgi:putative phage-type endonuclease